MDIVKELLLNLPQGFIQGLVINGGLILLAYYVFWVKFRVRFQNWRIQLKERVDSAQIKRELKNSLLTLLVGASFSSVLIYISTQGYTKIYTDISEHHWGWAVSGFFIVLLIDDTWFYWVHRLLHHPRIYKYVHYEHHKSIDVNPFTSMSFHVIEALALTLWILPASYFIPLYAPALLLVQIWGLLDNVKSHLGYELYPASLNKGPLRFLTSSTFHNMHHSKFRGNYGVHFRIWDKMLGTEFKDYEQEYDVIQERKSSGRVVEG